MLKATSTSYTSGKKYYNNKESQHFLVTDRIFRFYCKQNPTLLEISNLILMTCASITLRFKCSV